MQNDNGPAETTPVPLQFSWDDDDPPSFHHEGEGRLASRIDKIAYKGILALSAGCARLIADRLKPFCPDPVLFQMTDAAWAASIDPEYMHPPGTARRDLDARDWKGPDRVPIFQTCKYLYAGVGILAQAKTPLPECVILSAIASHVLPDLVSFKNWRRFAIGRLSELHPWTSEDPVGSAVPREILDPDSAYQPAMAGDYLSAFLKDLDYKKNPFLRSPDEMRSAGFTGTPYAL